MIHIDGSMGEGGGQVLRTSLALSLVTGEPVSIDKIRAGRARPGLMRQHLTAVVAAAVVGGGALEEVEGAALGATSITFRPGPVRPGQHRFAVGTAGSASLVLQTVLPPLLTASGPSRLELEGGTHNPHAPPFEFLHRAFLPLVERLGPRVEAHLLRPGFFPAGGGEMVVEIEPAPRLGRLDLEQRGAELGRRAVATVAHLPRHIAERELAVLGRALNLPEESLRVEEAAGSRGPGNAVRVEVECERVTEVFTGFGQRGVPAERVARGVARQARRYLEAGVAVAENLADQLLLPLALGPGGVISTLPPSRHFTTNVEVIRRFLPLAVAVVEEARDRVRVVVE